MSKGAKRNLFYMVMYTIYGHANAKDLRSLPFLLYLVPQQKIEYPQSVCFPNVLEDLIQQSSAEF